jgi:hypothetical protein
VLDGEVPVTVLDWEVTVTVFDWVAVFVKVVNSEDVKEAVFEDAV